MRAIVRASFSVGRARQRVATQSHSRRRVWTRYSCGRSEHPADGQGPGTHDNTGAPDEPARVPFAGRFFPGRGGGDHPRDLRATRHPVPVGALYRDGAAGREPRPDGVAARAAGLFRAAPAGVRDRGFPGAAGCCADACRDGGPFRLESRRLGVSRTRGGAAAGMGPGSSRLSRGGGHGGVGRGGRFRLPQTALAGGRAVGRPDPARADGPAVRHAHP